MSSPEALRLARTAQAFHRPPSSWLHLDDDVVAYAVDEALAVLLVIDDRRGQEEARRPGSSLAMLDHLYDDSDFVAPPPPDWMH